MCKDPTVGSQTIYNLQIQPCLKISGKPPRDELTWDAKESIRKFFPDRPGALRNSFQTLELGKRGDHGKAGKVRWHRSEGSTVRLPSHPVSRGKKPVTSTRGHSFRVSGICWTWPTSMWGTRSGPHPHSNKQWRQHVWEWNKAKAHWVRHCLPATLKAKDRCDHV